MKKRTKIILAITPAVLIIGAVIGSLIFLNQSYDPMLDALVALESDTEVLVEDTTNWFTFTPLNVTATTGFIFYPGGNVEPESYSLLARGLALEGYFVSIVKMPFDLAVFAPNKAAKVIDTFSNITTWIIGGHSLGGSMASKFVYDSPNATVGLVLLASYPADSNNLSTYDIAVISIYGSLDGVLSKPIDETKSLLPINTTFIEITGGNHAYFGSYGEQKGDFSATITRHEQQLITITEISAFISNL